MISISTIRNQWYGIQWRAFLSKNWWMDEKSIEFSVRPFCDDLRLRVSTWVWKHAQYLFLWCQISETLKWLSLQLLLVGTIGTFNISTDNWSWVWDFLSHAGCRSKVIVRDEWSIFRKLLNFFLIIKTTSLNHKFFRDGVQKRGQPFYREV